jgi:periplasmic divalent cation tolerance protein
MIPVLAVAMTTCPPEHAHSVARELVEARVAACVQVLPAIHSVYRWQGDVQVDGESLLLIKTPVDRLEACKAQLLGLHPYDVPEWLVLSASEVAASYLAWAIAETR